MALERSVHIDTGPALRGGQRQVLLLLNEMQAAGHDFVLLARSGSPLEQMARRRGFQVAPANIRNILRHGTGRALVHAHDARAHTMAVIGSRAPVVVSRRVAFPVQRSFASRWKYRRPRHFLAVSRYVANELVKAGVPPERVDVVYDGVATDSRCDRWHRDNPAVTLSSDDPMKGRDLAEEAAHAAGIPLVFSDDLERDLQDASMFLYLTRSEGFGSAALLAMQMGVPVVASAVGGLIEIINDGVSGLLVENEIGVISRAIREIQNDKCLANRLIEGGRSRVQECFTARHLLERTLAVYRKVLSG